MKKIKNRIYKRVCKRCNNLFDATGRYSGICPKCTRPNYERFVRNKVNPKEKIK